MDEEDSSTADEMLERYSGAKRKQQGRRKTGTRRNAISDKEINLYRKAVEKCGNAWKKILGYFIKHKDLLCQNVAEKYLKAFKNIDDKEQTKPMRNRLGNIGRKTKTSQEIKAREEQHILDEGTRTAEEIMKAVRDAKEKEKADPLNLSDWDTDGDDLMEPGTSTALSDDGLPTDDENELRASPSAPAAPPAKKAKKGKDPRKNLLARAGTTSTALSDDGLDFTDDEDEVQVPPSAPAAPPTKKKKKGKDPLKNLHDRAESLLNVGMLTAKMHMTFLKKNAESQGFSLSDSDID